MTGSALPRRPGFLRPDDSFYLAPDMPMDGALGIGEAVARMLADWEEQVGAERIAPDTLDTHTAVVRTLVAYATACGCDLVCDVSSEVLWQWVNSPATGVRAAEYPSENIRRLRRAVAVAVYRTWFRLGITERNLGASLPSLPGVQRVVSAFTAEQIQELKDAADGETDGSDYVVGYARTPVCLALTLVGAQSGEVGAIRVRDIDQMGKAVFLHGGGSRYQQRWVPVDDDWAWQVILDRLAYLHRRYPGDGDALLAYLPNERTTSTDDFKARSAATSMSLTKLIRLAGVHTPGKTRVASINEYVASRVFAETGRVEAVAARLGLARLDVAAHLVGYDWRAAFNPDPRGRS
ncbi:MAG: hypothetical protein U0R23_06585 [Candidatus Nanopelagicales bacterium]